MHGMESGSSDLTLYREALVVLGAAAIGIPLFLRLRISSVIGFTLVGAAVGPYGLAAFVPDAPWLSIVSIREPASIEPVARRSGWEGGDNQDGNPASRG